MVNPVLPLRQLWSFFCQETWRGQNFSLAKCGNNFEGSSHEGLSRIHLHFRLMQFCLIRGQWPYTPAAKTMTLNLKSLSSKTNFKHGSQTLHKPSSSRCHPLTYGCVAPPQLKMRQCVGPPSLNPVILTRTVLAAAAGLARPTPVPPAPPGVFRASSLLSLCKAFKGHSHPLCQGASCFLSDLIPTP